jgi:hypothetical protein
MSKQFRRGLLAGTGKCFSAPDPFAEQTPATNRRSTLRGGIYKGSAKSRDAKSAESGIEGVYCL